MRPTTVTPGGSTNSMLLLCTPCLVSLMSFPLFCQFLQKVTQPTNHSPLSLLLHGVQNSEKRARIFQLCLIITKITINGLSQLNFETKTIVILVIVMHMCAQLENLLHILRARFWQNNTRCITSLLCKKSHLSLLRLILIFLRTVSNQKCSLIISL